MENNEQAPEQRELSLPNRKAVYALTTITFITSIIGLVFAVMYIIFWSNLDVVLAKGDQNAKDLEAMIITVVGEQQWGQYVRDGKLLDFFMSTRNHYLLIALTNLLTIVAAFMMRAYKKTGFYVYVVAQILFLASPFLLILNYSPNWRETALFAIVSVVFTLMYSRNLKYFK